MAVAPAGSRRCAELLGALGARTEAVPRWYVLHPQKRCDWERSAGTAPTLSSHTPSTRYRTYLVNGEKLLQVDPPDHRLRKFNDRRLGVLPTSKAWQTALSNRAPSINEQRPRRACDLHKLDGIPMASSPWDSVYFVISVPIIVCNSSKNSSSQSPLSLSGVHAGYPVWSCRSVTEFGRRAPFHR